LFLPNQDTIRALAILNNEAKLVQLLSLVKVMVEMPNVLIPLQKRGDIDSNAGCFGGCVVQQAVGIPN
jgi:hypothetical protein